MRVALTEINGARLRIDGESRGMHQGIIRRRNSLPLADAVFSEDDQHPAREKEEIS